MRVAIGAGGGDAMLNLFRAPSWPLFGHHHLPERDRYAVFKAVLME